MSDTIPATCMPDACFCEAIRADGILQPANAISSFAFVIVALIIFARGTIKALSICFGITLILVGLGSYYYHAHLNFTGQTFDILGMYLVATVALMFGLNRLKPMAGGVLFGAYATFNAVLIVTVSFLPALRRWIFAVLLLGVLAVELKDRNVERKNLMRAIAIMSIAFFIWIIDFMRIACAPTSIVQGHAIWHILGAVATWYLYKHYENVARIRQ